MKSYRCAPITMALALFAALTLTLAIVAAALPAKAQSSNPLLGGPHGVVKSADGGPLEGMMVQLIAKNTAIRTTVFTDADGHYEFPKLAAGAYVLHIAQPREFFPYARDPVEITGADPLSDIILARITKADVLPPYPEIVAQMTGSEWL